MDIDGGGGTVKCEVHSGVKRSLAMTNFLRRPVFSVKSPVSNSIVRMVALIVELWGDEWG